MMPFLRHPTGGIALLLALMFVVIVYRRRRNAGQQEQSIMVQQVSAYDAALWDSANGIVDEPSQGPFTDADGRVGGGGSGSVILNGGRGQKRAIRAASFRSHKLRASATDGSAHPHQIGSAHSLTSEGDPHATRRASYSSAATGDAQTLWEEESAEAPRLPLPTGPEGDAVAAALEAQQRAALTASK